MKSIKAVVFHAPGDERVEMVPMPACGADEIRIAVDACAVCGSDLKAYMVGNPRIKPPIVVGHEFTGIVETVGAQVQGFATGERVVMATSVSCGECFYCKKGWRNLCANSAPMGYAYPGGMAEYLTIPARAVKNGHVIKVPANVPAVHAALAEPLSCAINAAENSRIQKGDTVVVAGAGPMGIINAVVARACGATKIILTEVNALRLKQAEAFGFDMLLNPDQCDLPQVIKKETGGLGADVVIVAAPSAKAQEQAIEYVRKRGTVCLFASLPAGKSALTFDSRIVHYGEIVVVGTSDSAPGHVARAVEMINGTGFPADKLASHVLKLDDIMQAYELMKTGEALRVVLVP